MSVPSLSHTLVAGTPENVNHVQDNFQDLVDFLSTAFVDDSNIAVGANIDGSKLLAGSVGTTELEAASVTGPKIGVIPTLRVTAAAAQSIPNNTVTSILFDTERWDLGTAAAQHDNAVNPARMICKDPGIYHIGANVDFASGGTLDTIRLIGIRHQLTTFIAQTAVPMVNAVLGSSVHVSCDYVLALDEVIDIVVYQNDGGAINVAKNANRSPEAWWHKISA